MAKKVQTSKADFRLFKQTCLYYIDLFGITEYEIGFKHEELKSDTLASTGWWDDRETKIITLRLALDWTGTEITPKEIEAVAFHEVLHVFLCRMNNLACERFCANKDIDEECHSLINRIMKAFTTR